MRILVISADNGLSGMWRLVQSVNRALLDGGTSVRHVVPHKQDYDGMLARPFIFAPAARQGQLEVVHWPHTYFLKRHRDWLLHEIEKEIAVSKIDCVVAFDVFRTGYAAALACYLRHVPFFAFATWSDAFVHHMTNPQEMESVATRAQAIVAGSPLVLNHLDAFHKMKGVMLKPDRPFFESIAKTYATSMKQPPAAKDRYVVTSGLIDQQVDYGELIARAAMVCSSVSAKWCHLGMVDPQILVPFMTELFANGLGEKFEATGMLDREDYFYRLMRASAYLKPFGGELTNDGFFEALALGVKPSLPDGHWLSGYIKNHDASVHYRTTASVDELAQQIVSLGARAAS